MFRVLGPLMAVRLATRWGIVEHLYAINFTTRSINLSPGGPCASRDEALRSRTNCGGVNCGTGSDAEKSSLILAHKLSTDRAFAPPVLHTLAMHSGFPHSSCTFFCVLVCFVLCRSRKAFATTHKEPCSTNGGLLFAAPTARRYSGR